MDNDAHVDGQSSQKRDSPPSHREAVDLCPYDQIRRPYVYGSLVARLAGAIPPVLAIGVVVVPVLILVGVAYPAVWSRQSYRRKAALEVLAQLLRHRS